MGIDSENSDVYIKDGLSSAFACTKEFLLNNSIPTVVPNKLTYELDKQIENIVNSEVSAKIIDGGCSWEAYKKIRNTLFAIKRSDWDDERKKRVIAPAYSLLNLFNTAVFPMSVLEQTIIAGELQHGVSSPEGRLDELWTAAENSDYLESQCIFVADVLDNLYKALLLNSPKLQALDELIQNASDENIAIIVPKAYYADILRKETIFSSECIHIVTANRFDSNRSYDKVIAIGDFSGKRFDALKCKASAQIIVLLYECETHWFKLRKQRAAKYEKRLNIVSGLTDDFEDDLDEIVVDEGTVEQFEDESLDLNEYIRTISMFDIRKFVAALPDSGRNTIVFVESNAETDVNNMDDEECSLELLYRDKKIYGTGLGVSVDWEIDKKGIGSLWSDFFPISEVPPINFDLPINDTISAEHLSMKYLSDLDTTDKSIKLDALRSLVDLYKAWVDELERAAETLDSRHQSAAAKNIAECKRAYIRMYSGLTALENNIEAYSAFVLANRAMFMQRVHLRMQQQTSKIDRYPDDDQIAELLQNMDYRRQDDNDCRWRPFQIAFLLMDINSVINDESPERDIVDLIWFPTGGGKTEAYLGLTAFTIFYRRLTRLAVSGGTAVIMRYTLRLLAAQQFTRAATLICACEYIRQDCEPRKRIYPNYSLGKEPITIGLWIGGTHIPNKNDDANFHLKKLLAVKESFYVRNEKDRHNKFQVLKCPWCGTKLVKDDKDRKLVGTWGYKMRDGKHFYMSCTHEDCDFTARLPIQIIDEELYDAPPTLLFGTVDKFAMLPWDGRIGSFFAVGSENRAPELIIQDELHLISGALGTIVGLYETAVDAICSQKGVRPKIIASTATIRRAKEQCSVLYNRDVVQFPAPGLDSGDSFFACEAKISYKEGVFGRKYVGLMPSGKTKAMMEIRAMAALLQRIHMMKLPDEAKDKLWTLTAYFNSLKDLGKASTLVEDDVKDFIIRTANRLFTSRRLIISADELTSRVTTTELNETLDKLEKLEYSRTNIEDHRYASNVLLATNMISVGIDVARLNVMLLIGQPKLTSEYIQASSRVGRSFPGVAFVQYDATKSRDRSHYERFRSYHESFYRFVEPTGATPFSKPARERALHAVLTSIIRQRAGLAADKDAALFDKDYFSDAVSEAEEFILDRIKQINIRADNGLENDIADVQTEIREFIDEWQKNAKAHTDYCFGRRFMVAPPSAGSGRLLRQYNSPGKDNAIETLTSMRNVDTQVLGEIVIWEEN